MPERPVVTLRLFAAAREAAGRGRDEIEGETVGEVLAAACRRYGAAFEAVLATSRVWVNGEAAEAGDGLTQGDEVAVLPPVSGGAGSGPEAAAAATDPGGAPGRRAPTAGRAEASGRAPETGREVGRDVRAATTARATASDRAAPTGRGAGRGAPAAGRGAPAATTGRAAGRAPGRRSTSGLGSLFPEPALDGPRVGVGLLWAVGTIAALLLGPVILALWMAPVAAAAAAQAARTWRPGEPAARRPAPLPAFVAAGLFVLASAFGPYVALAAAVLAVVGTALWATADATGVFGAGAGRGDVVWTLACAAVPAVAAGGPVLLRSHGLAAAAVVLLYALVYDAAAWIVGSESRHGWLGPVAGMACIASATIAVAAVLSQFKGDTPWLLGALAAVLAPLGGAAATLVLGDRRARVPALRRLDSLVLLGSVWAIVASRLVG